MPIVISGINEGTNRTCNMIRDQIQRDKVKIGEWNGEGISIKDEENHRSK
jgi:hypothetical protein